MDTFQVNIQEITKKYEGVRIKKDDLNRTRLNLEVKKAEEVAEISSLEKIVKKFRELESILKEKEKMINYKSYLNFRLVIFGVLALALIMLSIAATPTAIIDILLLLVNAVLIGIATYSEVTAKRKVNKKLKKVKNRNPDEVQERLTKLEVLLREKQNTVDKYQEQMSHIESQIEELEELLEQIHNVLKELYSKRTTAINKLVLDPMGEEMLNEEFMQDENVLRLIRSINIEKEDTDGKII